MKKYLIIGPAASGKDWLQRKFVEKGFSPLVQYTARPIRPNETCNEYHFVDSDEMVRNKEEFVTIHCYKWWYGFKKNDFDNCNVAIMTIGNLNDLRNFYGSEMPDCEIIYLDIPYNVRKERLKYRYVGGNEDDTIERRMTADEKDFENFKDYTIRLTSQDEVNNYINTIPTLG